MNELPLAGRRTEIGRSLANRQMGCDGKRARERVFAGGNLCSDFESTRSESRAAKHKKR